MVDVHSSAHFFSAALFVIRESFMEISFNSYAQVHLVLVQSFRADFESATIVIHESFMEIVLEVQTQCDVCPVL